jgi:acetyl/propionyl-CoA carboxylase alpha subunit
MGNKVNARAVAARYGLPLMPGSGALEPGPALLETGRRLGFPVLVKAAGGGIGMLPAHSEEELLPAGYREGMDVTPHYDPLLAKVIVHRSDREQARVALMEALQQFAVAGVKTNIAALLKVLDCDEFKAGRADTQLLSRGVAKKGGDAR